MIKRMRKSYFNEVKVARVIYYNIGSFLGLIVVYLGRHPIRCPDRGVLSRERGDEVRRNAKIDQFHVGIFGEQYIVAFNVTVHAVTAMQIN